MNTHDIELPPLPQGEYRLSPDSRAPTLYDEEAMQAYARAAIEADRQARGGDQRTAFEAWITQPPYNHRVDVLSEQSMNPGQYRYYEAHLAWQAWQEALKSPEVRALYEALKEVVDAADGEGWGQLDPGLEKQRAALAAMEKQK